MRREILISATRRETRVALLEDGRLVELMFDRPETGRIVGDIYLGKVDAVLAGIQAAFVDIGMEKAGFLHASDLERPDEDDDDEDGGNGGGGRGRSKGPPIQDVLRKGEEVLVQVTKEPISTKGPRLTSQISLPGRFLVYMPTAPRRVGVSRKIDDREERSRLKALGKELLPSDSGGIIIRTVGEELTREKFEKELKHLQGVWKKIQKAAKAAKRAPAAVHQDAQLIGGVIRDLFSDKFDALTIDSKKIYDEVRQYVKGIAPDLLDRVHLYSDSEPLFDLHGVEEEIQRAFQRKVELASGGYLIIEPTEALVSIDVNTGRFTGKGKNKNAEKTILRTNLDAAQEVAKQLRLRDIGGIIVIDFIDMESQSNRDRVLHELRSHLGRDRARTKAFEVSNLGLVEMTRQRIRPSLFQALTDPCEHCGGTGRVYTPPTVVRRIERALRRISNSEKDREIVIRVHPEVALQILEEEPRFLQRAEKRTGLELELRDDPILREDEFRLLSGPAETDVTDKFGTG